MTVDKKELTASSSGPSIQAAIAMNNGSAQPANGNGTGTNTSFSTAAHRIITPTTEVISVCSTCGQAHDPVNTPHLYDYREQTDPEMLCHICQQPLVDPEDACCRHTFCRLCILAYFRRKGVNVCSDEQGTQKGGALVSATSDDDDRPVPCPADPSHTITFRTLQPASNLVRRILEKLLVVCPNVDYCEEVLPRCDLATHLCFSCLGALSQCPNSKLGCKFVGPRATIHNHTQCECAYRNDPNAYQYVNPNSDSYQSANELAFACAGTSAAQLRLQAEQKALAHGAFTMMHNSSAAALTALDPSAAASMQPIGLSHNQNSAVTTAFSQQSAITFNQQHATMISQHQQHAMGGMCTLPLANLPVAPVCDGVPFGAQATTYHRTTTTSSLIGVQQRTIASRCPDEFRQHQLQHPHQHQSASSQQRIVLDGATSAAAASLQRSMAVTAMQSTTMQTQSSAQYVIGGVGMIPPLPPPLAHTTRTTVMPLATPFDATSITAPTPVAALTYEGDSDARTPVIEGEPCTIEMSRGGFDLGISIVGGVDTPLSCVIIQEIYVDGVVARDGRLRAGDQVLEVNGADLRQASHSDARDALRQMQALCRLTIYRDRADIRFSAPGRANGANAIQYQPRTKTPALPPPPGVNLPSLTYLPGACDSSQTESQTNTLQSRDSAKQHQPVAADMMVEREEKLRVTLYKQSDKQLGIKLAHKRSVENGLFVAGLVADSLAVLDGRLRKDDRLIEINGVDMTCGTKEHAAQLIQSALTSVELVVIRKTRAQTPDILRQTGVPTPSGVKLEMHGNPAYPPVPETSGDDVDTPNRLPLTPSKARSRAPLPPRTVVPIPLPVASASSPLGSDQNNNEDDTASVSTDFPPPPPELTNAITESPRQPPPLPAAAPPPLPPSLQQQHKSSPQQSRGSASGQAMQKTAAQQAHNVVKSNEREKGCDSMLKRGALSLNLKLSNLLHRARHDGASATDEDSKDEESSARDKLSKEDRGSKHRRSKSLLRKKKSGADAKLLNDSPCKGKRSSKSGKPLKSEPSSPSLLRRGNHDKSRDDADADDEGGVRKGSRHARSQANLDSMAGLSKSQSIGSRAHYAELLRLGSTTSSCREKVIELQKTPNESLGMSVAGGLHSQRGDIPIYVTNVQEDSCAARSQRVGRGDVVLSVNQRVLLGLTHDQAVLTLRTESQTRSRLVLKLIESPEPASSPDNFMPTWLFWLRLPTYCQIPKLIELERDRQTDSLGFAIIGGVDVSTTVDNGEAGTGPSSKRKSSRSAPQTPTGRSISNDTRQLPIVVRSIVPDSPSALDGRLRCGDLILALNNFALDGLTHQQVVALLKQLPSPVTLTVVSWPGTIV